MDERLFDMATRRVGRAVSRRGALAGLSALAAALPLGAAAKNGQDDRSRRTDRPDAEKKKKCKPAKCPTGCCSGKKCKPGTEVDACGTGGAACVACAFGETCIGGACVAECSPANCWGCCDPVTNACRAGTSPDACGAGGMACASCAAGEVCPAGTCEAPCGPANCAGCCDATTNVCEPGTAAGACGSGGVACATCDGTTPCCVAGACAFGTWANAATFGSGPGAGPSQLDGPSAVAIDADGQTALVADTGNNRMSMWRESAAAPVTWTAGGVFGSAGILPNQFATPLGVALAGDGLTAWVADSGNHRVDVWVRPGAASSAWAVAATFGAAGPGLDQFHTPWGVAVSPDLLSVWVSNVGTHRVSIWTRPNVDSNAWTWQASFGGGPGSGASELSAPMGLAVTADGMTALVADAGNSRVSVWTRPTATSVVWSNQATFGSFGPGADQFDQPRGVALADGGRTALVADPFRNRVSMWTRPTAASAAWTVGPVFGAPGAGASQFSFPAGIATAGDGRGAWIADQGNSRISVWEATCP